MLPQNQGAEEIAKCFLLFVKSIYGQSRHVSIRESGQNHPKKSLRLHYKLNALSFQVISYFLTLQGITDQVLLYLNSQHYISQLSFPNDTDHFDYFHSLISFKLALVVHHCTRPFLRTLINYNHHLLRRLTKYSSYVPCK